MTLLDALGELCHPQLLNMERSKNLLWLLNGNHKYAQLVECRKDKDREIIVVKLDIELTQNRKNQIKDVECIAIIFSPTDDNYPEILALREDFPTNVGHLNQKERPVSLCLYEEPFSEIRRKLTAFKLVERIRQWLSLTAKDMLHEYDQTPEPILPECGTVIIPSDFERISQEGARINFVCTDFNEKKMPILRSFQNLTDILPNATQYVALHIKALTVLQGRIRHLPESLFNLQEVIQDAFPNLITHLRNIIKCWHEQLYCYTTSRSPIKLHPKDEIKKEQEFIDKRQNYDSVFSSLLVLIFSFPRKVTEDSSEQIERKAFIITHPLREIAESIDALTVLNGFIAPPLIPSSEKSGKNLQVFVLRVLDEFNRDLGALCSGTESNISSIVLIGGGALGSQVYFNLIRSGYGKWKIIDNDTLLPHNLARHFLDFGDVGFPKAKSLAIKGCQLLGEDSACTFIKHDIFKQSNEIDEAIKNADVILDCSASVAVAKHIAICMEGSARRVSLFLNPAGTDLVLLTEGKDRSPRLDHLEMQYYRAIIQEEMLKDHYTEVGKFRYSGSCRDITNLIPQDYMGLHAALGSSGIRKVLEDSNPCIRIWHYQDETQAVQSISVQVSTSKELKVGEWKVIYDGTFAENLYNLRKNKLPNETGGILIGSIDRQNRIIYLVIPLTSPPDSYEYPICYIRGYEGLRKKHEEIQKRSLGELYYVGEWHSHPDGGGTRLSNDDKKVLVWLSDEIKKEELPAFIIIAADKGFGIHFSEGYSHEENWPIESLM